MCKTYPATARLAGVRGVTGSHSLPDSAVADVGRCKGNKARWKMNFNFNDYSESELLDELYQCPRLAKVLMSGKYFIVVTHTEPYFREVYDLIRNNEMKNGTWTDECEDIYQKSKGLK